MANDSFTPMPQPQIIRRLLFTAGVLLVYRLGCQVPAPGINIDVIAGLRGMLKTESVSIFALGVTPFFSILFLFEFIKLIVPPVARWETREPRNAQRLSLAIPHIRASRDRPFCLAGETSDSRCPLDIRSGALVRPHEARVPQHLQQSTMHLAKTLAAGRVQIVCKQHQ